MCASCFQRLWKTTALSARQHHALVREDGKGRVDDFMLSNTSLFVDATDPAKSCTVRGESKSNDRTSADCR